MKFVVVFSGKVGEVSELEREGGVRVEAHYEEGRQKRYYTVLQAKSYIRL